MAIPLNGYIIANNFDTPGNVAGFDQADFSGDGIADLALVDGPQADGAGTRNFVILTGRGHRAFNPEHTIFSNAEIDSSTVAMRANADSKPDILVYANTEIATAHFFLNQTSGSFGGCGLPTTATGIHLCSPTTYTSTTTKFSLSAAGQPFMHGMELWVDGVKKYQQFSRSFSHYAFLDTTITFPRRNASRHDLCGRRRQLAPAQGLHHHGQIAGHQRRITKAGAAISRASASNAARK